MSSDPQRFAQRVLDAFRAAGNRTDAQIIKANGPSTTTMTKLRKVAEGEETMSQPREPTWTNIDSAAAWAPGTARRVWDDPEDSTTQNGLVSGPMMMTRCSIDGRRICRTPSGGGSNLRRGSIWSG